MAADVIELVYHHRAVALALVRHLAEMRDHLIGFMAEVAAGQDAGAVRRRRLDDDHRRAATGALAIVAEVARAGQAAVAHVRCVGAKHDAVLQRCVAQFQR